MKKFLALYMAPAASIQEMMKNTSKEDMQAGMNAWTIWMNENAKMFVDQGAPAGKTTRVTAEGISSSSNDVTGYSIVQAETREEAAEFLKNSPHFKNIKDAYIDVMDMMDM
jgi:hypothetical protein